MFGLPWHYDLIRKYVVLFGTLFNDIHIKRSDQNGETVQTIKVPLVYGPREKMLARISGDPNLDQQIAIVLPVMSFEMTSLIYAPERKFQTTNRISTSNSVGGKKKAVYAPVPYDMTFTLSILAKNIVDANRIIEQILPFFTPEWTATVNLIPEMEIKHDIPLILSATALEDSYEGPFDQGRTITYTLDFMMKGFFYGPTRSDSIIRQIETQFYQNLELDTFNLQTIITPGLTSNGQPTSNSALSIDKNSIEATDNYGFIELINENL
jgi:hypothetical protein